MHRAILTLLVGLMLSLGGAASALTFKSDGSVVQNDGKTVKERRYSSRTPTTCSVLRNQNIPKYSKLYKDAFEEMVNLGLDCGLDKTAKVPTATDNGSGAAKVQVVSGKELSNEPWHAANSKSYEKLALKYWCITKSDFRGNLTSEPFIDVRGKSKFCGSSKKRAHRFQQIPYQAVKEFFSQESQKQTLCSRVKPFASYEEVAALKLSDSNKSALSYFLLARDIGLSCREEKGATLLHEATEPKALVNAKGSGNHQTLKVLEFIHENRDLLTSSAIASVSVFGTFDDNRSEIVKYSGFLTVDSVFLSNRQKPLGHKIIYGVIYGKLDNKAKHQKLRGWTFTTDSRGNSYGKVKFDFVADMPGSFFQIFSDGRFIRQKNYINARVPKTLELGRQISFFEAESSFVGLTNAVHENGPEYLLQEITSRIGAFKRLEAVKQKNQRRFEVEASGGNKPNFGNRNTKTISELETLKTQLESLLRFSKTETAKQEKESADERNAEEAETLRLAKLEEERKAKEAEVLRLAKLEEEHKAKEAEARRLAKLEEERKAKEAEARRLAKLEEERKAKEAEARRLAKLEEERKAKEAEARRLAEADQSPPIIFAEVVSQDGYDALIRGVITDDTALQDMAMNGQLLDLDDFGGFEESIYIPRGGKLVTIEAMDKLGKLARFELKLERQELAKLKLASFEELTPSKRRASYNDNAVAIIIGIAQYQRTEVPAIYADQDANYFYDYAALKLGVPERNIIDLVNENANAVEIFLATENFLRRKIKKDVTDVYIFYAGHGLATDDGSEMYLLPYDGAPQLLARTAISRKQLFNDIAASNPKSVTVFLDTCYSGTTRGTETLIASRPIAIKARQQDIPEGFTVMTAAAGDQTAKPLEEAKHGMFSYFLMKGMEGDADANQDNQITAGELHAYVQQNVIQQSSGSQTPELQGDADKVLVRFQ